MANAGNRLIIKKRGGTAEVIIGAILVLFPLMLLDRSAGALPLPIGDYLLRLAWAAMFCLGLRGLAGGLRKQRLYQKLLRLQGMFDDGHRVPLEAAAGLLRCSLTALVTDVRAMQKRKLTQGLYADLIRKDLVCVGDSVIVDPPSDAVTSGITLREEHKKSALPIYALAVAWASYALFLPIYRPIDLALALILSLIAFFLTSWNTSSRTVIIAVPPQAPAPVNTGNEALDGMLRGVQVHMDNLRRLDKAIDGKLDEPVRDILNTTEQIIDQVKKRPGKSNEMRQFFNYTLPTTISLLQNYDELRGQPVQGQNITRALEKIEGMMGTIVESFHRQLDALFADKALDIDVELDVMQQMLTESGNDFNKGK